MVAEQLNQKLRNLLYNTKDFNIGAFDKSKSTIAQRPVLVILDRMIDMNVCLQHQWNYRALVFDVLDMKLNRVTIEPPEEEEEHGNTRGSKKKTLQLDLEFGDEFWEENSGLPFQDVASLCRYSNFSVICSPLPLHLPLGKKK